MLSNLRAAPAGKQPPSGRSPQREGLALALARRDKAKRELDATVAQIEDFRTRGFAQSRAVEEAEAAVETAKTGLAHYVVRSAFGSSETPPQTPREAREALEEARDTLEVLRETRATLEALRRETESILSAAEGQVHEAISAVVISEPDIRALVEAHAKLREQFLTQRRVLAHLANLRMLPSDCKFDAYVGNFHTDVELSKESPWRAALAALATNADAPLPT